MKLTENKHLRYALGERAKGAVPEVGHNVVFVPKNLYPYPWWHQMIFTLLGLALIGIATIGGIKSYEFVKYSVSVKGKIIGLAPQKYKRFMEPKFEFKTSEGKTIQVVSRADNRASAVLVGGEVDVLYSPSNPYYAEIDDWRNFWLLPIVFGFMGSGFLAAGISKQIPEFKDKLRCLRFKSNGVTIDTNFLRIERPLWWNRHPDNKPFVVVSSWRDPYSAETYHFRSKPLWTDPTSLLADRPIRVYLNPRNPLRYWMDLTVLSENNQSNDLTIA